jgi:hypothetical protein
MTSCVVEISAWKGWNIVLPIWKSSLIHKVRCSKPFWSDYHQLLGNHLQYHMGNINERIHNLAKDVKLSAHGRHPTTYLFTSCCFIVALKLFFLLFSKFLLLLCFQGQKGTSVQV